MRRFVPTFLVLSLGLGVFATVSTPVQAEPTPGLGCRAAAAGLPVPRIVPEAEYALDYLSYDEARECLRLINQSAPQYFESYEIGRSAGWRMPDGTRYSQPVVMVIITNEASPISFEAKRKNLYVLSIHGNEKGGREGGLRAIEDLARGLGIAQENPRLREYLDYVAAVFVFPNVDGWTHEEVLPFLANPQAGGGFVRGNGNGSDLNRQWPNKGWNRESYRSMGQPEIVATVNTLKRWDNWAYGTDIHGMLTPADAKTNEYCKAPQGQEPQPYGSLLMGMLSAGQSDPQKMLMTTRLAELLKVRVNADPNFREWSSVKDTGLWGGRVMEWGTSWDTIGYVDSGFTGDFIFQRHGFDAGDIDFELSYNHLVFDNHYLPGGMEMNRLHVRAVRQVVAVFLEAAATDVQVSYETHGHRTAYLYNPKVVTNRGPDGAVDAMGGWAEANANDDAFDYLHVDYAASANDYFADLRPFLRDGDRPGSLDAVNIRDLHAQTLGRYDTFIVAGSAFTQVAGSPISIRALQDWTAAGGRLVLTDEALQLLGPFGVVDAEKIKSLPEYAGFTNFLDRGSPLVKGLRGLARQTYEAVPLGYEPGRAPIWYVEAAAWPTQRATRVGVVPVGPSAATGLLPCSPTAAAGANQPEGVNLGEIALGEGTIRILGALLPDPSEEYYHPYGLDSYATTYTGNLLFRNLVDWEEVYADAPVVAENVGQARPAARPVATPEEVPERKAGIPGFGATWSLLAFAVALVVASRRRLP